MQDPSADPPPEGYEQWQPKMGRGGKLLVYVILAFIALGTALMAWQGLSAVLGAGVA
jgi:TRAP-type mannitol/chloroaromatic compound transport system permease small subunit